MNSEIGLTADLFNWQHHIMNYKSMSIRGYMVHWAQCPQMSCRTCGFRFKIFLGLVPEISMSMHDI